jgi:hypothetical protein
VLTHRACSVHAQRSVVKRAAIDSVDGTVTRIDTYTRQPHKDTLSRVCMGIPDAG